MSRAHIRHPCLCATLPMISFARQVLLPLQLTNEVGKGDGKAADGAAVESMRSVFDSIPFNGRVAIGEGERDDAPMLWIGEMLGSLRDDPRAEKIDIAVDPLECTNHVAYNKPNAMAVLATAPQRRVVACA